MIVLKGKGVSRGIVGGRAFVKDEVKRAIEKKLVDACDLELLRLEKAVEDTKTQLRTLRDSALKHVGEKEAQIFEAHLLMLEDPDFLSRISEIIATEHLNAEYAVKQTKQEYSAIFSSMDDDYMRERARDVEDIATRLIDNLLGNVEHSLAGIKEPSIIIANDLLPSDTVKLDRRNILGIVTQEGGETSHSSILARSMQIPAVVGVENLLLEIEDGDEILLDGESGKVIVRPDFVTKDQWLERAKRLGRKRAELEVVKGTTSITADGFKIAVMGNIGTPEDLAAVLENDGEGIGLFRSEFLYMGRSTPPDEETQLKAYKKVLRAMGNRKVIIRTLDAGGDKNIPYLKIAKEENPFLGHRAIRVCLDRPDIFKTQLRALLRASTYGRLGIMFPMISTLEEVRKAKAIVEKVKQDLNCEKVVISEDLEVGIMIETPAAALISRQLAEEVDFFSIGTNDLTQYTLAADRMNAKVAHIYDVSHPAVLYLVGLTIRNAQKVGIPVGICGEAAADPSLIEIFAGLGINELSVNASSILEVKAKIQQTNMRHARARCREIMSLIG